MAPRQIPGRRRRPRDKILPTVPEPGAGPFGGVAGVGRKAVHSFDRHARYTPTLDVKG